MTNPTPEQMLKLAKICEPDTFWALHEKPNGNKLVVKPVSNRLFSCPKFDPLNKDAQLMQVVFALLDKGSSLHLSKVGESILCGISVGFSHFNLYAETKRQAILNLAVEVLL